jgi:hypothetical protein
MWRTDLLIDAAAAAVRQREDELAAEQAVHGLDSLEEVELHPLLAAGFAAAHLGVLREQPYPHEWRRKLGRRGRASDDLAQRRDRLRCDLVLTPDSGQVLVDPMKVQRTVAVHRRGAEGTLFEPLAAAETPAITAQARQGVGPEEAYWLEVKLVGQFAYNAGIPGPNRMYASELRRSLADLDKLADDREVRHAGLLLVAFTIDQATARHDLTRLMHACLDRDLSIGPPEFRHTPIAERIGNHACTLCLVDLRKAELYEPGTK